ncbi:hypothetical protein RUND412_008110 [Rhizina undulata]
MPEKANTTKKVQKAAAAPAQSVRKAKEEKKVPAKPVKVQKSNKNVTSSDDESDLEDDDKDNEESTSGSGSEGDSDTDSGSESGESVREQKTSKPVTAYSAYKPPPSFKIIPPSSSITSNPFSAKNLEGKELWFITAPSAAPLSKIEEINPVDVEEGNPILEAKNGRRYCLQSKGKCEDGDDEESTAGISIAVPDGKGGYRIVNKPISKALQLVEALPTPPTISTFQIPKSKPVREQPEGLRMRFKPIGFEGPEDAVTKDVDMMDLDTPKKDSKANGAAPDGEERKKKKHKSSKEDGEKERRKRKSSDKKAKAVEA